MSLVIALRPADAAVRSPGYRPDNLEHEAQLIAANYRPGDIVFFIPVNDRTGSLPFPGSWRKPRDIALAKTPAAANDPYGTAGATATPASPGTPLAGHPQVNRGLN